MAYTKQTWTNNDPGTPLNGPRLSHLEDGVEAAHDRANHTGVQDSSTISDFNAAVTGIATGLVPAGPAGADGADGQPGAGAVVAVASRADIPATTPAGAVVVQGSVPVVPQIVSFSTAQTTNVGTTATTSTTQVLNTPTGLQDNDVLIAFVDCSLQTSASDISAPGWTRIAYPFVAPTEPTRLRGWFTKTVTTASSEPATHTFTASAAGRWLVTAVALRGDGRPVALASTGTTATGGLDSGTGGRIATALSVPYAQASLALFAGGAGYIAGQDHVPTFTPAGFTEIAALSNAVATDSARSASWVGYRNAAEGDIDQPIIGLGTNTAPYATQIAVSVPVDSRSSFTVNNWPWTLELDEQWGTAVAEGSWAGSAYNSTYPAYDAFADTSTRGMYRKSILSVHDNSLDIHVQTVSGEHRVAAVVIGPDGYTGQTYGRYAFTIDADEIARYKIAPLLWPNDPIGYPADPDFWQAEIDFPEVDELLSTAPVKALLYKPTAGKSSWSGWADTGFVLADANPHECVLEWTPEGITTWFDGELIGRIAGSPPTVPMRFTIQVETALTGAAPSDLTEGHVYIGRTRIWSYTPDIPPVIGGGASLTSYATQVAALPDYPATFPPTLGTDDNYVTDSEKAALHTHPAVIAQGVDAATARAAISAASTTAATTTAAGIVELATNTEATTGTDTTRAVTPSGLAARTPAASTTVSGLVELATTTETETGTDTARAVTPAGLKAVTDAIAPESIGAAFVVGDGYTVTGKIFVSGTSTPTGRAAGDLVIYIP